MDPARYRLLLDLIGDAMELPQPARAAHLRAACGQDVALLEDAHALLHDAEATSFANVTGRLEARIADAAAMAVADVAQPEWIGPFRILSVLGEGGMGIVYGAHQEQPLRRDVALKVVRAGVGIPQVLARFDAERHTLARLEHPHVASIFDAGTTEDGRPYFVMEWVHGEPITEFCDAQRLDVAQRLRLFAHVCRAVHHAHQKAVIHRDLKPSNVLVAYIGDEPLPKIIDFGIARVTAPDAALATRQTTHGMMLGTLEYMSPEQAEWRGGEADVRSDVYSLGVMLYELISGQLPFASHQLRTASPVDVQRLLQETDPPTPSRRLTGAADAAALARARATDLRGLARSLRGDLDWVVMKALEKDPARRYQSAHELALELERVQRHEPVAAAPPDMAYRARKFVRRHRTGVLAAAVAVLALLTGTTLAAAGLVRATRARAVAERETQKAQVVNQFLVDMLGAVQPDRARGSVVTVRDVLDSAAVRLDRDRPFSAQPEVEASIRMAIGDSYRALGEYDAAMPLLERALALWTQQGAPPTQMVGVLDALGGATWRQGRLAESLGYAREILALRERTNGRMSAAYSGALQNVANVHADMGDLLLADSLLRIALEIDRQVLPPDDQADLAFTLNNLGTVLSDLGRYGEAADAHRESLALRMQYMGANSPAVVTALGNLGYALTHLGRIPAAVDTARKAVALAETLFGTDHVRTADSWRILGDALRRSGELTDAESYLRGALGVYEAAMGTSSGRAGNTRVLLGRTLDDAGRAAEAESELERGWQVIANDLGPEHPDARDAAQALVEHFTTHAQPARAVEWRERAGMESVLPMDG